jgi:hypothetical protein
MGKGHVETASVRASAPATSRPTSTWTLWLAVLLLVYVLIVAVDVIGRGFSAASGGADGVRCRP